MLASRCNNTAVTYLCFVFWSDHVAFRLITFCRTNWSAMVLRFLVVNAPIDSWLANMYTVQICTKSSICGTRWTGVKGRTSSFQINLKSPITYRPLLNYAINILKDGPPSCDVINTFRINVNFSTRIFTLFDAIYLYMYLFTYFSKILSRMNHL